MTSPASNPNFTCDMDGYVLATQELLEVALIAVSLSVSTLRTMLPANLGKSLKYAYKFLTNSGSFMGYLVAALYFFSLEFGFGAEMCEFSGYVDTVIETLYQVIAIIDNLAPA